MTFNLFKRLLPNGKAWLITVNKRLRQFFEGLASGAADPVVEAFDDVFDDIDPQKTTQLAQWESQFALTGSSLTEQERRDRLEGAWSAVGGQSPRYIQDTLRAAGFNVYVHEWWEPNAEQPLGGSINGEPARVARDPNLYLHDDSNPALYVGVGHDSAYCGGDLAFANSQIVGRVGYLLVNRDTTVQYSIPPDPTKYPYFLYVGGETFPEAATVAASRQDELEALCLKICPAQQWLGMLITYS